MSKKDLDFSWVGSLAALAVFGYISIKIFGGFYNSYRLALNHEVGEFDVVSCNKYVLNLGRGNLKDAWNLSVDGLDFEIEKRYPKRADNYSTNCGWVGEKAQIVYNTELEVGTLLHGKPTFLKILRNYGGYSDIAAYLIVTVFIGVFWLFNLVRIYLLVQRNLNSYQEKLASEGIRKNSLIFSLDSYSYLLSLSIAVIFSYLFILYLIYGMGYVEGGSDFFNGIFFGTLIICAGIVPYQIFSLAFWIKAEIIWLVKVIKKVLAILFNLKAIHSIVIILLESNLAELSISDPWKLIELFIKQLIKL